MARVCSSLFNGEFDASDVAGRFPWVPLSVGVFLFSTFLPGLWGERSVLSQASG